MPARPLALLLTAALAAACTLAPPPALAAQPDPAADGDDGKPDAAERERRRKLMEKMNERARKRRGDQPPAGDRSFDVGDGEAAQREMDRLNAEALAARGDLDEQPAFVEVWQWRPRDDAPPHVVRFLSGGRDRRVSEIERATAFCHLLRDVIRDESAGREERRLMLDNNRELRRLRDEMAAACDPLRPVVAANPLTLRVGSIGWAEGVEARVLAVLGPTEVAVAVGPDEDLSVLNGRDTAEMLTGQSLRLDGWHHVPRAAPWQGRLRERIGGVDVSLPAAARVPAVEAFEMGDYADQVLVRVENPRHPVVADRLLREDRERTTRIRRQVLAMRDQLEAAAAAEEDDGVSLADLAGSLRDSLEAAAAE